jgi:hypothetical protein
MTSTSRTELRDSACYRTVASSTDLDRRDRSHPRIPTQLWRQVKGSKVFTQTWDGDTEPQQAADAGYVPADIECAGYAAVSQRAHRRGDDVAGKEAAARGDKA